MEHLMNTEWIKLAANDGHELDAFSVKANDPIGNIVVIQEIFGITDHIQDVCQQFASNGYNVVAPAIYDRFEKNITLDYTQIEEGVGYKMKLEDDYAMSDINAAQTYLGSKTAVVGYCYGGMLTHIAASKLAFDCAVSYYGGMIADNYLDLKIQIPIMYHFGENDHAIPMAAVDSIRNNYKDASIHVYRDAGHGFNCEMRADYHEDSAKLALERTLQFIGKNL
jgi:carboxymethylenebutenolidase